MSDDFQGDLPAATSAPEPAAPSTSDIVSNAIEIANNRAADREAGKAVDQELPSARLSRARDEHGKFSKVPPASQEPAALAPAPKPVTQAAAPAAEQALQAPARWNDQDKAAFASLPPNAQKLILEQSQRQEADYTRKTQEAAEIRKSVEPVLQAITPHADYLNTVGRELNLNPAHMIGAMIGVERTLRHGKPEQRAATLAALIRDYPVDFELLNQELAKAPVVHAPAPISNEIRQQLAELNQFRQSTEAERQKQREEKGIQDAQAEIDALKSEKDARGQLKYPHFDAVEAKMIDHVAKGLSIRQAYMLAVDEMGAQLPTRTAVPAQASDKDRQAALARARTASSPKTHGSTPGGSAEPASTSERVKNAMRTAGYAIS